MPWEARILFDSATSSDSDATQPPESEPNGAAAQVNAAKSEGSDSWGLNGLEGRKASEQQREASGQPSGQVDQRLEPPRASWGSIAGRVGSVLLIVVILGWTYEGAEIRPGELVQNSGNMLGYLRGFFPPDFRDGKLFLQEMWVTIQIAIWGTFLAVLLAVPCGLMASVNVSPVWLRQPVRRVMDAFRAINEMIFALLFVSAVGLGPFAGVLALAVHTLGTLAKLFSEAVEAVDPRPVEGIRAVGASWFDEIIYGILPQVMPLWISYTLYRFESNMRSASVVGMVGAGGIGMLLWDAIRSFDYGRTAAMLIIVVVNVTLIDVGSSWVRKRFI
jgi:phosphonate transport system permease protein